MEAMDRPRLHVLSTRDIAWLAGLVEGEGCISIKRAARRSGNANSIHLHIGMTDWDVLDRAAAILGARVLGPYADSATRQDTYTRQGTYRVVVTQGLAASWLMTLYPLLGQRRQVAAREALAFWRSYPVNGRMLVPYRLGHEAHGTKAVAPYNLH